MTGLAVITGASSGIGAALAPMLAGAGYDLLLVARRLERLEELAASIRAAHAEREVRVLALDVTAEDAGERLLEAAPRPRVLVNNAGMGQFGRAAAQSPLEAGRVVRLNCEALVRLTLSCLPAMLGDEAEGSGGVILNVGSIAGFQPVPYFAVYGATKAFVHSFSEALDEELLGTGVRVVTVAPGPVPTEFQGIAGSPDAHESSSYELRTPEQIAAACLAAIRKPRRMVVPAPFHRFMHWIQRFVPRSTVVSVAARKMRKRGV